MLIENSMLQSTCLMMSTSAGEKEISTNKICWVVQWITYKTRQFPKLLIGLLHHNLQSSFYPKPNQPKQLAMRIRCGIKCYQGHQNMPCGVYSHMMSTVQCNSTAPANSQERRSDDAIFMTVVTVKER